MVLRAGGLTGLMNQPSAQVIDGSLLFDGSSTYLKRTPGSAGNRKIFTWSGWVKRSKLNTWQMLLAAGETGNDRTYIAFVGSDTPPYADQLSLGHLASGIVTGAVYFNPKLRDTSEFYHLVVSADLTNSTANDRVKGYINGIEVDATVANAFENTNTQINNTVRHQTKNAANDSLYIDGQVTQVYFIDGQALTADSFGFTDPLTGTWRPKKFVGEFNPANFDSWPSMTTGTPFNSDYSIAALFDGSTSTYMCPAGGTSCVFTPTTPITVSSSIRIYGIASSSNEYFKINNTVVTNVPNSFGWFTPNIGSTITSLNKFEFYTTSGSYAALVSAIEIDGQILTTGGINSFYLPMDGNSPIGEDKSGNGNNFAPINFGGSVELDKATGALPILNTTQGGTQAGVGVFGSKENKYYTVTTANGSVYQFDITSGDNPSLSFIRGATYKFDYSSHTGHPLLFSTSNPDSSTTAYTNGTSIASNVISFTVPHDAPDTLYYYCSAHPTGMNGAISITTDETKADKYASNCVLALPLLNSANDVSTSIGCTSTTKTTAVTNAVASNVASNFYSGSYYFDGSGDYINVTAQSELSLQGDFTVECWTFIDTNVSNGKQISSLGYYVSGKDGNWYFGLSSAAGYEIVFYSYDGQSSAEYVNADLDAPQIDKWYHIAAVRIGTTVTLYVDGVSKASGTISKGLDNGGVDGLTLGRLSQSGGSGAYGSLNGYIQDLRIYNGVGKYTGNFIPAATNPDIFPDTPSV